MRRGCLKDRLRLVAGLSLMRTHRKAWSDGEKQQLRHLLQIGHSRPQIGRILNRRGPDIRAMVEELRKLEAAALDEDEEEHEEEIVKGRPGYDRRYSDAAVRAASEAFSAAIDTMIQRRRGQAAAE